MRHVLTLLLVVLTGIVARAQEFTIRTVEVTGESTVVHYDLIDTVRDRVYTISLYSSRDSYLSPLQKVSGDVGLEVRPGANRKIVWNSREELGATFRGELDLEVRGRVYIPFVKFDGLQDQVFKRGSAKTITWTGGTRQNILNFAIYKDAQYVGVIPAIANTGTADIIIPQDVKPGTGYYFLVSDTKNKDQVMKTATFRVKRKVALGLKVLPIVLIGASIPLLAPKAGPENLDTPPDIPPN